MSQHNSDYEEVEYVEEPTDNRRKKVVVYGEYDKNFHSPLRKKRIRISLMDIIIVTIILAILAFIGYRSFESYGATSRDDIRTGHLAIIREGMEKLIEEGKPLPEAYQEKEITVNNTIVGVQGYAGEAFFSAIGKNVLKDPLDNYYYIYYYQPNTQQYEVMAYLEGSSTRKKEEKGTYWERIRNWAIPPVDYSTRTPYSIGNTGNIVLANIGAAKGTPLNQVVTGNRIDLSDKSTYEQYLYLGANCLDILNKYPEYRGQDGVRLILLGSRLTRVYCDMTTEGGGWTLFYANNGHPKSPTRESYVQMRTKMASGAYSLSNYTDTYLAGLLDASHFTTNGAKEILAKNRVGGSGKWVKFTFDTSESLAWALGKDVLGETQSQCYSIPNNGTWSIVNNDGKIKHENLKKIMNHGGTSWGVSHDAYNCNGFKKGSSPHIGFYNSQNNTVENRARGNEGVGGKWGDGNEYRYFIR